MRYKLNLSIIVLFLQFIRNLISDSELIDQYQDWDYDT